MRTPLFPAVLLLCVFAIVRPAVAGSKDLAAFFTGHLIATGQFKNLSNGSTLGVKVDIRGRPIGKKFQLTTSTTFSDGANERKVWTFQKLDHGRYLGQRADLIGTATAAIKGQTLTLRYTARVPSKDGKLYTVSFLETFRFTSSTKGTNLVRASVLSIPVGQALLSIVRISD